jgi:hypothetical protein
MKASPKQGTSARQSGPGTSVKGLSAKQDRPASIRPTGNTTSGSSQGHSRGKQG